MRLVPDTDPKLRILHSMVLIAEDERDRYVLDALMGILRGKPVLRAAREDVATDKFPTLRLTELKAEQPRRRPQQARRKTQ